MSVTTRAFLVACGMMIIFSASISAVPVAEESTNPSYDPVVEAFRLSKVDPNVNLQTAQKPFGSPYKKVKITWGKKSAADCKWQCACKPNPKTGCKSSVGPMSAGGCDKGVKLCRKPCKRYRWTEKTKTCELFTWGNKGKSINPTPKPAPKPKPTPKPTPKLRLTMGTKGPKVPALFGHNQINGPVYDVPFNNKALVSATQAMYPGQLRYPGGTVANYWYLPNATYIEPCAGNAPATGKQTCAAEVGGAWQSGYANTCTKIGGKCYSNAAHCDEAGGFWTPGSKGYCGAKAIKAAAKCGCCTPKQFSPTPSPTDEPTEFPTAVPTPPPNVHLLPGWCRDWSHTNTRQSQEIHGERTYFTERRDNITEAGCIALCDASPRCHQAVFEASGPWGAQCWLGNRPSSAHPAGSRGCRNPPANRPQVPCVDFCYNKEGWTPVPAPPPPNCYYQFQDGCGGRCSQKRVWQCIANPLLTANPLLAYDTWHSRLQHNGGETTCSTQGSPILTLAEAQACVQERCPNGAAFQITTDGLTGPSAASACGTELE